MSAVCGGHWIAGTAVFADLKLTGKEVREMVRNFFSWSLPRAIFIQLLAVALAVASVVYAARTQELGLDAVRVFVSGALFGVALVTAFVAEWYLRR